MVKKTTTLTVDNEIIERAKKMGLNMSDIAEKAIAEKTGEVKFNVNDGTNCEFCEREGEKETAEDVKTKGHYSKLNKLFWLWPDLKWICNSCLKEKSKSVPIAGAVHQ